MKRYSMKSYLSLITISAKKRRKQNRLTLVCIILAVFLVTSVFSLAEVMTKAEETSMIKKHGSHHVVLSGISEEEASRIAGQSNVSASAWYRALGEDIYTGYETGGKRVVLYGTEQAYVCDIRNYETEGAWPQNKNEVMLNTAAKERLGAGLGESITIHTPAGSFDYIISGFCMDEKTLYDDKFDGVCAYMMIDALEEICNANTDTGSGQGTADFDGADSDNTAEENKAVYYVRFSGRTNIRKAIADMKIQYALSEENVKENIATVGIAGAGSSQNFNHLYLLAAAVFVMILIAGVLMISSCMNSNVSQRTKFFGMMRCIGASRKQVMNFVRLEALNWCGTAVPIGLGLGIFFSYILCAFLKNIVKGEFAEFSFRISVMAIVCGVLVGVISVMLAAHSPAKRAADVSPMAAVSGNADVGKRISCAANTRLFKVETALGVYHAVSSGKNLILMSLSFALTAALFLTFFAGVDFVKKILPSASNLNPDISIAAIDNANSIEKGTKEEISKIPGVKTSFACAMSLNVSAKINGAWSSVDLISYDDYMFDWSEKSLVSGNLSKVDGDSDYVAVIFNRDSRLNTGDQIEIGNERLEIACVMSEGIGTENRPALVCTEETFRRITGEENYVLLNVQLAKDATEKTVDAIRELAGENEFADRRGDNQDSNSSFWVFRMAGYGFLAIIALITVFNIVNSISMSVSARMKQYGVMRAVGMSGRQITKMIAAEAVTYAVCGLLIGCMAGLYFHRLLTTKLIIEHFGGVWRIPLEPVAIIAALFALACAAAVHAPAKRMRDMAITETINEL